MDYLGAEISKKIKSAIRAKLVELGVYVDDELPDYIMVLVANKKTKSQMERDLTLFLSDHTIAFVQWLQEVLDKLQTITLAKDKEEGKSEGKSEGKGSAKEREKKRKSSEVGSESAKKVKTDDLKEKEQKRGEAQKPKKDKDSKHTDKEAKPSKKKDEPSKKKEDRSKDSGDVEESRIVRQRGTEEKPRDRQGSAPSELDGGRRSSRSVDGDTGSDGRRQRRRSGQQTSAALPDKKHPRVSAPAEPADLLPPADEEEDQDVLNLSAEEDELKEAPPAAAARQSSAAAASAAVTAPAPAAAPRQQTVKPTPAVTVRAGASGGGGSRMVNLREESGMLGGRRVVTEGAPAARRRSRSRSPTRRVKVADAESRWSRRGPQSTVGAVVSREEDDTEYDPLNPAVGAVASTVRVTERPRRPASQQPRPTLLLKAMRDAQRSTVASVRPFLVRPSEPLKQQKNRRETRELYTASLIARQRRQGPSTLASDNMAPRAVQSRSQRSGSPGQIAITVRNSVAEQTGRSPGRRRRHRSRQPGSPPPPREKPQTETAKQKDVEMEEEDEEGEKKIQSPEPAPSSDDEDTVHVTIGKVKAHSHRTEPAPAEAPPEYRPTPVLTSVDDISAIVHAVADRIKNPPPQTERPSSPTFVVTMTGLGASRFARSIDSDSPLGAEDPPPAEGVVVEEEEEEEEELEEESLRAQLLEDRARKRAHPAVIAPPPPSELETAPAPKPAAVRCRFWPNCKVAACTFHHPTVPCKTFPACKFGDACLYVHPLCKFDGSCTRRDCRFSHSAAARPAVAAPPAATLGGGVVGRASARPGSIATECKFFPNCTNPACPYIHPKMCRYGEVCSNASCLFAHPTPALPGGRPQFKWVAPGAI